MVYEPVEDSALLAQVVAERAHGAVLDMGTGSGIQALAATKSSQTTSVLAADIDPEAVAAATKAGIRTIESDLFSNIEGVFDTIISNTPYLPDEPLTKDIALDGGPRGFEWTLRFLSQAKAHLARDGQMLILISTRTNPGVVEQFLLQNAFDFEIVARQRISYEELLVYHITWALPGHPAAQYIARGKRGRIYRDGDKVIKKSDLRRIAQEAPMLQKVNVLGIGPKYFSHTDNTITMEYIEGPLIREVWETLSQEDAQKLASAIWNQAERLDAENIDKSEMGNPYKHIIVTADGPVQIDWERARITPRPQNCSQFREYLKKVRKLYGFEFKEIGE